MATAASHSPPSNPTNTKQRGFKPRRLMGNVVFHNLVFEKSYCAFYNQYFYSLYLIETLIK